MATRSAEPRLRIANVVGATLLVLVAFAALAVLGAWRWDQRRVAAPLPMPAGGVEVVRKVYSTDKPLIGPWTHKYAYAYYVEHPTTYVLDAALVTALLFPLAVWCGRRSRQP